MRNVPKSKERAELEKKLDRLTVSIESKLNRWSERNSRDEAPRILTDRAMRDPYKRFEESKGPLNQIHIRLADNQILDVASCSSVIAAVESFSLFRAYVRDEAAAKAVEDMLAGPAIFSSRPLETSGQDCRKCRLPIY